MLLGKRPRPPIMRRTRSMSGGMAIETQPTVTNNLEMEPHHEELMSDSAHPHLHHQHAIKDPQADALMVADQTKNMVTTAMFPSPITTLITVSDANNHSHNKNPTTNLNLPNNLIQHTPHFLRTCRLCTSPLAPGRDIYMYRGDTAFCSLECREKQIKQDQRKEKWKVSSNKDDRRVISPPPTVKAKSSTKSQTAACN